MSKKKFGEDMGKSVMAFLTHDVVLWTLLLHVVIIWIIIA